jgi:hypothetical protein
MYNCPYSSAWPRPSFTPLYTFPMRRSTFQQMTASVQDSTISQYGCSYYTFVLITIGLSIKRPNFKDRLSSLLSTNSTLLFPPRSLLLPYYLKFFNNIHHIFNNFLKVVTKPLYIATCFGVSHHHHGKTVPMMVVADTETCSNIEWFCNNL